MSVNSVNNSVTAGSPSRNNVLCILYKLDIPTNLQIKRGGRPTSLLIGQIFHSGKAAKKPQISHASLWDIWRPTWHHIHILTFFYLYLVYNLAYFATVWRVSLRKATSNKGTNHYSHQTFSLRTDFILVLWSTPNYWVQLKYV